ncbi:hypothetical protein BB559_001823 [Furculomyces boomerangus]|uniref:Uncharacterized protein n=1 Tax=Furculomyces boomerangus TaxID=61424 RepID=A0A2T9Z072_9FUNG|nr:hypothetical protein BB559_001823 [Furculomyces boomerangus]
MSKRVYMMICAHLWRGRNAGWQYLAEKSHNLPTTVEGWYYYHKWKNYRVIMGAVKKATYYGVRIGAVTAMYQIIEATLDRYAFGYTCVASSVVSGSISSLTCAIIARLPKSSFKRLIKMGTFGGLCIGVMQDGVNWYETKEPPPYLRDLFENI